jgi:hypothetical protein
MNKEILSEVSTVTKGENSPSPPPLYPLHYCLISECKMKPSRNLQYHVKDLRFDNIVIFLIKNQASYLSDDDVDNIQKINKMHRAMVDDILLLREIDFSKVKLPRYDYADQTKISQERVDLMTVCAIHYGLNTSMVIRYLKGKYVGESRDADKILERVLPYIDEVDCKHIKRIINQGCPSHIDFEEDYDNKHMVLRKGNQQTFLQFPEKTAKAMNKEEKNTHVIAFRNWLVHFLPYCRATPQGIREKYGKHRVIFDSSTQTCSHEIVLNHETSTDQEAIIDFGKAKTHLLINIYNWQISYPNKVILLALAEVTACFRFPRLSADVTGAFGFVAKKLYFASMSHVFGLNTSASSWEPLRQAIKSMITVYAQRDDLVDKHRDLLDELMWSDDLSPKPDLTKAIPCNINKGVIDDKGILLPMTANIYVDYIFAAAALCKNMLRLLSAIIKAIFTVCGVPDIAVRQCPLSLEKWHKLILGLIQIVLGLVINTNTMTVGIMDEYIDRV